MDAFEYKENYELQDKSTNFIGGILGAFLGAIIGTIIWVLITYITHYTVNFFAILIGTLIGISTLKGCKKSHILLSLFASLIALASIVIGNCSLVILLLAKYEGVSVISILPEINYIELFKYTFFEGEAEYMISNFVYTSAAVFVAFVISNLNKESEQN